MKHAITPTRKEDFAGWYQKVIAAAQLADNAPVRGCMVIRPWGYALWENIQHTLDKKFKKAGNVNAYFPLLIPLSFLEKEAEHVDGFAKECAVVTHHRLEEGKDGELIPTGELEEPLVIRPTSETLIGDSFSKWIQSYRDLPLRINQWSNVLRWEMRPRLFLRSSEFLWQEGHTAHASENEARQETYKMIALYESFLFDHLAIPVSRGKKCSWERFPGAVETLTIEAMMQDGKSLQAATSHFLGQNFSKASNISFSNKSGKIDHAWTTSWGMSTRIIGALIMSHGDDDGLVIPPRIAPVHIVIVPILNREKERVLEHCEKIANRISNERYSGTEIIVEIDSRDMNSGEKKWHHIKRGIPIRIEIGLREIESSNITFSRRDMGSHHKENLSLDDFLSSAPSILDSIQANIRKNAQDRFNSSIQKISDPHEFKKIFMGDQDGKSGFVLAPFVDRPEVQEKISSLGITLRCIPDEQPEEQSKCIFTGEKTDQWAIFARAY